MSHCPETQALQRIERTLARAVQEFAARLRLERASTGPSSESLLRLLGIDDVPAEALADGRLCPRTQARIVDRLGEEDRRLVRLARRASPAYDLNRHMAVRRLIGSMIGGAPKAPARPASGFELNRRFARSRRPRLQPVASAG